MLHQLLDIIQTPAFSEDGNFCIVSASWQDENEDLEFKLKVNTGLDVDTQHWKIVCRSVCEHKIVLDCDDRLVVSDNHILLWPYTEKVCSLWFSGPHQEPFPIIGELWREHNKLTHRWLPFGRFLNGSDFVSLIADGHGKLAEGPEPLIIAYQQVMQRHGFKTSTTSHKPRHWNGHAWVDPGTLVALVAGGSWVIASTVEAFRIE